MLSPLAVLSYSLQVAALVGVTFVVLAMAARQAPRVRLASWRLVLGIALALPLAAVLPWGVGAEPAASRSTLGSVVPAVPMSFVPAVDATGEIDWTFWLTALLVAGAAVHLTRLLLGWARLAAASRGTADDRCAIFREVSAALDAPARLVWCAGASHPFTFGTSPAVVVMPADLAVAPDAALRAIFTHELLHVARHDWRWLIADEVVIAVVWFHPAMRLALRELRQAREEVVDRAAIAITGARRTYVETLITLAARPLAPAALSLPFFGARQLRRRVAALMTETPMSRTRFACTSALVMLTSAATVAAAARAFPLPSVSWELQGQTSAPQPSQEPGPLERQAYLAPRDAPPPARTRYVAPALPAEAAAMGEFEISLRLTIDAKGNVAEARALLLKAGSMETPGALNVMQAVVDSSRRWQFEPPAMAPLALTTTVTIKREGEAGKATYSSEERPIPAETKNAEYPADARKAGVEGEVQLEVTIDRTGRVERTRVLTAPLPSMGEAAAAAIKEWLFRPATKDGQPVPVTVTIAVKFALK